MQLSPGRSRQHSTAGRASLPVRPARSGQRSRPSQGRPGGRPAAPAGPSGLSADAYQQPEAGSSGQAGPSAGRPAQPVGAGKRDRRASAGSEITPADSWPGQAAPQGRAGHRLREGEPEALHRSPSRQKSGPLPPGLSRAGSSGQQLARAGSGAGLGRAGSGPGLPRAHSGAGLARAASGAGAGASSSGLQPSPSTQLMNMLSNIERELASPQKPPPPPPPAMPPRPYPRSPEAPPPSFSRRRWAGLCCCHAPADTALMACDMWLRGVCCLLHGSHGARHLLEMHACTLISASAGMAKGVACLLSVLPMHSAMSLHDLHPRMPCLF